MKGPLKEGLRRDKTCGVDGMLCSLCTFILNILGSTALTSITSAHTVAVGELYGYYRKRHLAVEKLHIIPEANAGQGDPPRAPMFTLQTPAGAEGPVEHNGTVRQMK